MSHVNHFFFLPSSVLRIKFNSNKIYILGNNIIMLKLKKNDTDI
jgi:hypothetical protein